MQSNGDKYVSTGCHCTHAHHLIETDMYRTYSMPPLIVILVYRSCLLLLGGDIVWYMYSVLPWKAVYWLVDNGGIHVHPVYCIL